MIFIVLHLHSYVLRVGGGYVLWGDWEGGWVRGPVSPLHLPLGRGLVYSPPQYREPASPLPLPLPAPPPHPPHCLGLRRWTHCSPEAGGSGGVKGEYGR